MQRSLVFSLVMGFFGLIALSFGIYQVTVLADRADTRAADAEQAPYQVGVVTDLPPNSQVLVTGELLPGERLPEPSARVLDVVESLNLIAYDVMVWVVERNDNDDRVEYRGSWQRQQHSMPPLTLALDERTSMQIMPADLPLKQAQHRDIIHQRQEYIEPPASCTEDCTRSPRYMGADYQDEFILAGSLMVVGYAPGDTLSVLGSLVDRRMLQPAYLMNGTRADLLASMQSDASNVRFNGFVLIAFGVVFAVIAIWYFPAPSRPRSERVSQEELILRSR